MKQHFYEILNSGWRPLLAKFGLASFLLFALISPAIIRGQDTSAQLSGQVTDSTGAVVSRVQITVHNTETGLVEHAKSDDSGQYRLAALPPGLYKLSAEMNGFSAYVQTGIKLTVGQFASLNIALKPGAVSETVTVTGGASLINATTAEISQVIEEDTVKELPLNGRDPSSLVFLTAGISNDTYSSSSTQPTSNSFPTQTAASAGGGRQGSTYYMLDGVSNMDTYSLMAAPFPNSDATQEFRVISNNFDATYGFSPGAVVSIQTKSGSNNYHGGVYEFIRNNDLNAADYFSKQVDELKRNQFGAFAGGKIVPNKLFFFASYQGTRNTWQSSENTSYDPTSAMLQGDFSAVSTPLSGPFVTVNGKPNQVNPALFSPGALKLTALMPLGQNPLTGLVYITGPVQKESYDELTTRFDYTLTDQQRLFLRSFVYNYNQPSATNKGDIVVGGNGQGGIYINEALNHTWSITPSLLNRATAFWSSYDYNSGTMAYDKTGNAVCLSEFIKVNDPAGQCYLNGSSVGNGFNLINGNPNQTGRRTVGLADSIMWMKGKHALTFGVDALHQFSHEVSGWQVNPNFQVTGQYTGNGLADFLLGDVYSITQAAGESNALQGWMTGFYVQDQFKVRPNLTLNYGLRWDPNTPPVVYNGRGAAFIPGQQSTRYPNAPAGLVFPGDAGVQPGIMPSDYKNFEPRVGLSWQPSRLPNTAVRAGFGMFEAPLQYAYYNHVGDIQPFNPNYTLTGTLTTPLSLDNPWATFTQTSGTSPFPPFAASGAVPPTSATFITGAENSVGAVFARNFKLGITESWNLSVEQQVTRSVAVHLAYVGNHTYHQSIPVDLNPGLLQNGNDTRPLYTAFGGVLAVEAAGTANYNSLQAGVEKRMSKNWQLLSNFTWSKTMDTLADGDPSWASSVSDPYNIKHDDGLSSLNFPLIWPTTALYTTPSLLGKNPLLKQALGSWEVSGIWTMQSGEPMTIKGGNGNNNSGFMEGQDRADRVPGEPLSVRKGGTSHWIKEYFNTAAFAQNAAGTPGDSMKYMIQGAPYASADMGINKNWTVLERAKLQFRWEMFNAFNHPSFDRPNRTTTSGSFGQITDSGPIPARVMQGALKLTF